MNLDYRKRIFEDVVKANFGFAEHGLEMHFVGVRACGGNDPRDATLVARYTGSHLRFDIGWNEFESSLAVLIKFDDADLSRQESYVYFEPFIEYLTNGEETAIVPYIAENMSIREIKQVMKKRLVVFEEGLAPVVAQVAKKMQCHFGDLKTASAEQIRSYHRWMKTQRNGSKTSKEVTSKIKGSDPIASD